MIKVLAIEDERAILENILEILEVKGFEAHGAINGHAGIELTYQLMPDLILCDINMPEMDGYSVLMSLRSDPRTNHIPFVFLTAYVDRTFQRKGMRLGAEDYLTKPFTAKELVETVNTQIEKRQVLENNRTQEMETLRSNILLSLPHEMRTPLTGIITCADMLLMDFEDNNPPDNSRIEQMVRIMHNAGTRLQRLIENYLVYSQIELFINDPQKFAQITAGEGIDNISEIAIVAAQQAAEEVGRTEDLVQGEFASSPRVRISENNLSKIIFELVDNALKFSEPGTPVQIDSEQVNGEFALRVTDQGSGMTPEQMSQVGAYMQFNRSKQEQQGLGLGLVIAKRLAELHGGRVTLDTNTPQGIRATIWLALE